MTPVRGRWGLEWTWGAAIALTVVVYVWPLALDAPLVDPDEGLHAAIAQEMLERGDMVMPRFLGEPFLDKPILYFWALAASLRVAGESELGVRLPGLLFGWLGAVTTALVAWQVAGRHLAILAFCLYATMILPFALAQIAVHDVALVAWTNLALLFLWRAHQKTDAAGAMGQAAIAGIFVGLAVLTKGLAGVALVGLPFAVWLLLRRRLTPRMLAAGLVALAVGAALAAPWYLAMERAHAGYLRYFFVDRHLLGFATTTQIHGNRPWWYYLPLVAGGALPWVAYLPLAARSSSLAPGQAWPSLAWTWLIADMVLLSTAKSKLVTYALPAFPAIALLAGLAWSRLEDCVRDVQDARSLGATGRASSAPTLRAATAGVWLHAIAGCAIAPVGFVLASTEFGVDVGPAAWACAAALAGGYVWMIAWWRAAGGDAGRGAARVLALQLGLAAAMFVVMTIALFPRMAEQFSARAVARYFNGQGALPARTWIADERVGSVVFYLDGPLRRRLTPSRIENVPLGLLVGRLPSAPPEVAIVLAERDVPRFARGIDLSGVPYQTAGRHRIYAAGPLRQRMLKVIGGR